VVTNTGLSIFDSALTSSTISGSDVIKLITGGIAGWSPDVSSTLSIKSGGLSVTGGMSVENSATLTNLLVTGTGAVGGSIQAPGLEVIDGLFVTSGVSLSGANGMAVDLVGMTVEHGGIEVNGGLSVVGSLSQESDVSIFDGGVVVVSGGLTLLNYGIKTAKTVVYSDGMKVTGGLTVYNGGMKIANGFELEKGDMYVKGGMEVTDGGVRSTTSGASVYGGITIYTGGLDMNGNLSLTHESTANFHKAPTSPSDEGLKKNITVLQNSRSILSKVNGVYFTWKSVDVIMEDDDKASSDASYVSDGSSDKKRNIGLIAQDLLEVVPEAVTEIYNGKYYGVQYEKMLPLIIEAVRELHLKALHICKVQQIYRRKQALKDDIRYLKNHQRNDREHLQSITSAILPKVEDFFLSDEWLALENTYVHTEGEENE